MLRTAARRARPGFTLVELLVSAAVCVLIMAILSGAFSLGIDNVRHMKSAGDMMDQLRGAGTALKADLAAPHVMDENGTQVKLSTFRADETTVSGTAAPYTVSKWRCPSHGFMRIGSCPIKYPAGDPTDGDLLNAGTGIATKHYLHFTSIVTGNSDEDYFRAVVPQGGTAYHSTAAEIAWFLEPMGQTAGASPLHRLIRRQRLLALSDTDRRDRPWPSQDDEAVISLRPTGGTPPMILNTLADVTNPRNRLSRRVDVFPDGTPNDTLMAPMSSRVGEDTVLSNVLSFEVQVHWTAAGGAWNPSNTVAQNAKLPYDDPTPAKRDPAVFDPSQKKSDEPFDTLPQVRDAWNPSWKGLTGPNADYKHVYDSWSNGLNWTSNYDPATPDVNRPPLVITVRAVQVRIRIWDPRMQTARQVSFVQDL